ncbi:MAG: hypothetical protein ACRDAM_20990 [Casimicrobium sp.]
MSCKAPSTSKNDLFRVDRSVFTIATHESAAAEDRAFWRSASIEARWQAVEHMRMIAYGYETPPKFEYVFEVVTRGE